VAILVRWLRFTTHPAFPQQPSTRKAPEIGVEQRKDGAWNVFYVVAPDGLCYWFGERQAS
jgi:hypothetical protein